MLCCSFETWQLAPLTIAGNSKDGVCWDAVQGQLPHSLPLHAIPSTKGRNETTLWGEI